VPADLVATTFAGGRALGFAQSATAGSGKDESGHGDILVGG
jgi:hypothetical protein